MNLLKRENWWIWLLLFLSGGSQNLILSSMLDLYDKNEWYAKAGNWILASVCFVFPFFIMFTVFTLESTCMVAAKLNVPGKEIYNTPYTWILCIIVPIFGWILGIVMALYLNIDILIQLAHGEAEQYIK